MHQPQPPPLGTGERSLLELNLPLSPSDRKRIIPLTVEVPPGTAALAIYLEYDPRWARDGAVNQRLIEAAVDEQMDAARAAGIACQGGYREATLARLAGMAAGMRNLLNLVLQDPSGAHRGRWDQNLGAVEQDWICPEWASPGYQAGALPPGPWRISVEVHEVISPHLELCLRVAASDVAPPAAAVRGKTGPARPAEAEFALALPEGWLRGELHCHSTASDGQYSPERLVERAQKLGLDFVALSDHNSVAGLDLLEQAPLPVIPGCEITTFRGHFLSLGLRRAVPWYEGERLLDSQELAAAVREAGGLFGLAHPFVLGDPICVGCRLQTEVHAADVDLLEVWSRGPSDPLARSHALALLDRLWRGGHRVTAVAGRDWHGSSQERANGGQLFPATCLRARPEVSSLLEALRRGACYLSVGPHLALAVRTAGQQAGLGETVAVRPTDSAALELDIEGLDQPARARLLTDGRCFREERLLPGQAHIAHEALAPGVLRVEVFGEDGELLVLSNPVALVADDEE